MKLTGNAEKVLQQRFYAEGEDWEMLCRRVADTVAQAEHGEDKRKEWAETYYGLLLGRDFLPNSPTLRNFGRNKGCGSACFVLPIEDSRKSIFKTLADAVDIQAYGGGTGFSFSRLRPRGELIRSTGGRASGPVSFMSIYDYAIGDIIKQGGVRSGANMAVLRVDHPDVEDFIRAKSEEGVLKNFNISVGITDAFMKAVQEDMNWDLVFGGEVYKTVPARKIWDRIVEGAWLNGEPGIVFLDTVNRHNPLAYLGEIEATNPCGEQPLLPYGSCNLGSINLSNMVKGDWIEGAAEVDTAKLEKTAALAVRFLDSVITVNHYPVPEVGEMAREVRQIGIGVTGFADLCIKLRVRYGSNRCIEIAEKIMRTIYDSADRASRELGKEKGVPEKVSAERRNGSLTSIAPTGTISIIADCSSGIEPHFAFEYTKACVDDRLSMMPAVVREYIERTGASLENLPGYFVTTKDVSPQEHIRVQAAFQQSGVDSGVSKTINAPNHTTKEQVSEAFFLAWKLGCKGITFYRDGSRQVQALYTETAGEKRRKLARGELKERPRGTVGPSFKMQTACGRLYADPHFDAEGAAEIFVRTVGGGCEANAKALGVLCSMILRAGVSPEVLVRKLKDIHCPACTRAISAGKNVEVNSCAAGIGKALEIAVESADLFTGVVKGLGDMDVKFGKAPNNKGKKRRCPECGAALYQSEGCVICSNPECGWTKC